MYEMYRHACPEMHVSSGIPPVGFSWAEPSPKNLWAWWKVTNNFEGLAQVMKQAFSEPRSM